MLHVTDFLHYLYVEAPVGFKVQDCDGFKNYLDQQVSNHEPAIHSVGIVNRESLYDFKGNQQFAYIKVTVNDPKHIASVRRCIEECRANWKGMWKPEYNQKGEGHIQTFDMVAYLTRFMIDCDVSRFAILLNSYANLFSDCWNVLD